MKIRHMLLACAFMTAAQTAHALDAEKLSFETFTPALFSEIRSDGWKSDQVSISGNLYLPEGTDRVPVVLVVHGSGHVSRLSDWVANLSAALAEHGIGTFVIDSYTSRGIHGTAEDQSKLSKAARVVDAFQALGALRQHPRIDPERIGITGYSFGGIVALNATETKISQVLSKEGGFAASLPVYPSCQTMWENAAPTGAPTLILAGEADDYTRAQYCTDYAKRMQSAGHDVQVKVYPGAHHNWNVAGADSYMGSAWHFNDCGPGYIDDDGHEVMLKADASTRNSTWREYVVKVARSCGTKGTTIRFQQAAHDDTLLTTAEFFRQNLK